MALSREEIIAAIEARANDFTELDVPEWGGTILIRRLSANDADQSGLTSNEHTPELIGRVVAMSLVDADGGQLFTEEDVKALSKVDVGVAAKVFAACIKANGLSSDELDEAVAAFTEAQHDSSSSS